jgi:uncharacterized Zn finger protein
MPEKQKVERMPVPRLTEATIWQYASAESVERGCAYYEQGRVTSPVLRGTTLSAEVEGSEAFPYLVRCAFASDGSIEASCTCPYDWGGWCKHIVAVCLCLMDEPETIEERLPLEHLLADLDLAQARSILLTLAERNPSLVETIESEVEMVHPASTSPVPKASVSSPVAARRVTIDARAVRRQVRNILHSLDRMRSSEAYWHVGAVVNDIRRLLDQGWALIEKDQGRDALTLLEAVTDAYMEEWENLDDSDGEASGFFSEGLADDAIAALEPYAGHELIARVADAVLNERPAWVISASRKQAEAIMDGAKAQSYHAAASWLAKARAAYRILNREEEWSAYLRELLQLHARKYKLVPLLQSLQRERGEKA